MQEFESSKTETAVKKQAREETSRADLRWLMSDPKGRRFIYELLESLGMYRSSYNAFAKDVALEMAFYEGQKNVGYKLVARLGAICPREYELMMREHAHE